MTHEEMQARTKKAFADALKELMKEKPLNRITVKDLVERCNVNRKTFYYYFADIYDLLRWILEEETLNVVKQFDMVSDFRDSIVFILDYLEKNDYLIRCAYDAMGRNELSRFIHKDVIDLIYSVLDKYEKEMGLSLSDSYKRFAADFYADGISGLIVEWVRNPGKTSKETAVDYMDRFLNSSVPSVLRAGAEADGRPAAEEKE